MKNNPVAMIFNVFTVFAFVFIFFSPIIVSFISIIYNLMRYLMQKKGSLEKVKYIKRIKISLIIFGIALICYFIFFYWLSVNWHM